MLACDAMTLQEYIEQTILPQYDAFDGGHRRDHAQMVIDESLKLAREHGADEQMAYAIAAYHDLGLRIDREKHHIYSGEILMADANLRQWFTQEQLQVMRPYLSVNLLLNLLKKSKSRFLKKAVFFSALEM